MSPKPTKNKLLWFSPGVLCAVQVLNLTRAYIALHQDLVVPLIEKYSEEWRATGHPIYRPMWWLSPEDPTTYTIDDQFLIGDEVVSLFSGL